MSVMSCAAAGLAIAALQLPAGLLGEDLSEYVRTRDFVSPVTGERFTAVVIDHQPPVLGYDYDRCPHTPINVLAYTLVIDPASGYVDYPNSFAQTHWTAAELASILGDPRFNRSSPPGLPWLGAYPWEMLGNAAMLAEADAKDPLDIANWWLMAAWSVRLDVVAGENEFDDQVKEMLGRMPRMEPDLKDMAMLADMQKAAFWERQYAAGQLPAISASEAALAIAWLYRSRGELQAALQWLEQAGRQDPDNDFELNTHYLSSSIELESYYLAKAGEWFETAWDAGGLNQLEQGPVAYLVAEIQRRLGKLETSVDWYDQAAELNYGGMSQEQILRQRAAASGRGF